MKPIPSPLPTALAALALLASTARADLRRYQCNVTLAREFTLSSGSGGLTLPLEKWDGIAVPTPPAKTTYFFEFVINDAVQDTNASTTQSTFPGAIVSGAFFGPLVSTGGLTTSTTATHFVLTSGADIVISAGQATIAANFTDPKATTEFSVFGNTQSLPIDILKLTSFPVATNDTGAGQTFRQQAAAPLAWSDLTFSFDSSGANDDVGSGAAGTAGSNDIRFFTLVETIPTGDGVMASSKVGVGSPVTGEPTGTTFAAFGAPSINAGGNIAATATLLKDKVKTAAIVVGSSPVPTVRVRAGDPAPGVTDGIFNSFTQVALNDGGKVAFLATLKTGPGGVKPSSDLGLWSDRTGTLTLIAREGDPTPGGIANATVTALTDFALDGDGTVFAGKVKGDGINGTNAAVVWIERSAVTFVALRAGESVPLAGGGSKTIRSLTPLRTAKGVPGQGTAAFSGSNFTGLECLVKYTDGTSGLVFVKQTDTTRTLVGQVVTGVDAPGFAAGNKLTKLSVPTQSPGTDRFAFRGTVGAKTNTIFGFVTGTQAFADQAKIGTGVVNPDGFTVAAVGDPAVGADGSLAWLGRIAGTDVTTKNDSTLFHLPFNGEISAAIREGDEGPGIGGSKIKAITGFALAQGASDRFYFTAQLTTGPGGVTTKNDTALWGGQPGAFALLLREGGSLELNGAIRTVKSFSVFPVVRGSEIQRRVHTGKNAVVTVICTDGTKAIVPLALP